MSQSQLVQIPKTLPMDSLELLPLCILVFLYDASSLRPKSSHADTQPLDLLQRLPAQDLPCPYHVPW